LREQEAAWKEESRDFSRATGKTLAAKSWTGSDEKGGERARPKRGGALRIRNESAGTNEKEAVVGEREGEYAVV